MTPAELMVLAHDEGFQRRVLFALFKQAKAVAATNPGAGTPDEAYYAAVLNGEVYVLHVAVAVLVLLGVDGTDAQLDTAVATLWPFLAKAWTLRTP